MLSKIIRIHISAVRDPVVLAPGSGDPDHITHRTHRLRIRAKSESDNRKK